MNYRYVGEAVVQVCATLFAWFWAAVLPLAIPSAWGVHWTVGVVVVSLWLAAMSRVVSDLRYLIHGRVGSPEAE